MDNQQLQMHAKHIRKLILDAIYAGQSGHPGGSLGATDIMTALYFNHMDIDQINVNSIERDRFVLSKGHASPVLYATLVEKGLLDEAQLQTFRQINSKLQGHPDMKKVAGVDMTTGSLGQGFSAAVGMALANKLSKNDHRVYCLVGDGEAEEGQIYEAAMSAAHYHLDNLCVIIDQNGLQIDGNTQDIISPAPFEPKFDAFGFHVIAIDGHDFNQINKALDKAKQVKGKPTCIVAKTIKGKGVSFMENQSGWHGKAPNQEQYELAIQELEAQ